MNNRGSLASVVNSILADREGNLPIAIGCKNCGSRDSFSNIRDKNNKSVDECLQQESISQNSITEASLRTPRAVRIMEDANEDVDHDPLITDRTGSISR